MSTKNTSSVAPATEEQLGHILDMWKRRLKGRKLTLDEGNHIIRNGGQYHPAMDKAADLLVDQVRSDLANTIVRMVKVNRTRTAQQTIDATGRVKYINDDVLATMPVGQGPEEVEMHYFRLGRYASPTEVEGEFQSRSLVPDPQAQSDDNAADPAFADKHPNGTQWGLKDGQASYIAFRRSGFHGERFVSVDRVGLGWGGYWWFGGRKL